MQKCGHPPNLGFGGTVVAAFVTSFFAAHAADAVVVIFAFGPHAFFIDELRVTDWKHGVLSTGAKLPFVGDLCSGVITLLFWIICIGISELCAGLLAAFLTHRPRWMSSAARIIGGSLLFLFVAEFGRVNGRVVLFHPIPIAALIGGCVLIWKGVASFFVESV
jgi:hypothetical protein